MKKLATLALTAAVMSMPVFAATQPQDKDDMKKGGEHHPVIRRSLRQLQNVKQELNKDAARDFDGHRANAVKHIDEAIEELNKALESDKK